MLDLNAEIRELSLKSDVIRASGRIPAEIYGKQFENKHITVSTKDFQKIFKEAGENTIVNLKLDNEVYPVIIHDHQKHPITDQVLSIDFFKVRLDEKITAHIPLKFIGESLAVKEMGGILVKSMDEIEVEALPANLPHDIQIDISLIKNIDESIYVKDIQKSLNYKIIADLNTVIATVVMPQEEIVEPIKSVDDIVTEGEIKRAESAKAEE